VLWAVLLAAAIAIIARARYSADLSAFLPRAPTAAQRLLVEQLRQGVASRLIIVAIEGGSPGPSLPRKGDSQGESVRARLSQALAQRLRRDPEFTAVENGDAAAAKKDQAFLFAHRYLLSRTVTPERFSVAGLKAAIGNTIDLLASPAGMLMKSLVPSDPTGEMVTLLDQLGGREQPRTADGVWVSRDGSRALLLVRTRAAGSDTDGQQRAVEAIRASFRQVLASEPAAPRSSGPALSGASAAAALLLTGPGVFAVEARQTIKSEVTRLFIVSSVLIIALLLFVYRSVPALLLGLVPVASGALAGIAAVALGFGVVQGVTLGFGITLIGEGVDYSIYLFIQSSAGAQAQGQPRSDDKPRSDDRPRTDFRREVWPTIRLGMLTSVCGFAALLVSSFPGLAQLGLYSLVGVLGAGLATRFVLPQLLPRGFAIRDLTPLGAAAARALSRASAERWWLAAVAIAAAVVLGLNRDRLLSHDLSALSPVPAAAQQLDGQLRADLGAPDVRYLVVVSAPDEESALEGAEQVGGELDGLIGRDVISGFESPAQFLPSLKVQRERQASLPAPAELAARLKQALSGLPLKLERLAPFLHDVEAERTGPLLRRTSLEGTSFAAIADALLVRQSDGWHALLPLEAPVSGGRPLAIDIDKVRSAVSIGAPDEATVLDLKSQADALYSTYLAGAVRLSLAGFAAIVVLLLMALKSPARVVRVVLPLALAVLTVAAALTLFGARLTLLHVVGMLLIVAVGSNYALFFDRRSDAAGVEPSTALPRTLASLLVANCATVVGFGVLAFSSVPVLHDLGETVAPGAFLALLYAALLAREPAPRR
ncbi:MAG TPA: MMPL family transporter, partial [Steroidobacteraceae bacterium]|nr:MMPL family transporter [Steroidobacteraceae bacterium]